MDQNLHANMEGFCRAAMIKVMATYYISGCFKRIVAVAHGYSSVVDTQY